MSRLADEEHIDHFELQRKGKRKPVESIILPRASETDEPRVRSELPMPDEFYLGKPSKMPRKQRKVSRTIAEQLDSDDWRAIHKDQQKRRAERLVPRQEEIDALRKDGYRVDMLTEYQWRIDGRLDLFPVHKRWHDTKVNRRGSYKVAADICKKILRK